MVKKTKTTKKSTTVSDVIALEQIADRDQTTEDAKNALLIVSLTVNAFVFIGWITLQVTTVYDYQVAAFLFTR